jgi:hypothetical protein
MLERGIGIDEIEQIIASGDSIEDYPEDEPYPSRLLLGWPGGRPLHIVAADEPGTDVTHVITAYQPDPAQWEDGFRRRRT